MKVRDILWGDLFFFFGLVVYVFNMYMLVNGGWLVFGVFIYEKKIMLFFFLFCFLEGYFSYKLI